MLPGRIFEPLAGDQKTFYILWKAFPFSHLDAFHGKVLKFSVMSHETTLVSEEITKQNKTKHPTTLKETTDLYLQCLTGSPPRHNS